MKSLGQIIERFRWLHLESVQRHPFETEAEISARWGSEPDLRGRLAAELKAAIVRSVPSDFVTYDLLALKRALIFEEELTQQSGDLRKAVHAIWHHTGWRPLASANDAAWSTAMDLSRALVRLGLSLELQWDDIAPGRSAKRLADAGWKLSAIEGQFVFADGELERLTANVQSVLNEIGIVAAVTQVLELAKREERKGFGMLLFGRRSSMQHREPVWPYGFLLNLALRCPQLGSPPANANELFRSASVTARDLVAALDLETYYLPLGLIVAPLRIESVLRSAAQYEHLVGIKQWPMVLVGAFLYDFFSASTITDAQMSARLGWTIRDAIALWDFIAAQLPMYAPWLTTARDLARSGLKAGVLAKLLAALTHPVGTVNAGYHSPLGAATDDDAWRMAFLRPFVELADKSLLLAVPSAAGVAFFEGMMGALHRAFPKQAVTLLGTGTEALVLGTLKRAGFAVTASNAKYRRPVEGEVDALIETDDLMIIIESKAKAPTRVTMAGYSAEALLDYTGAVLESQIQALQHEILLRRHGTIELIDGGELIWKRRRIVRISVTLHDHGALQDPLTVESVTSALLNARFDPHPGYEKADQVERLQRKNVELAQATAELNALGVAPLEQSDSCYAFSAAQLAVFIYESSDPADFVRRISTPIVFGTQNPLSEYFERLRLGSAPPRRKMQLGRAASAMLGSTGIPNSK